MPSLRSVLLFAAAAAADVTTTLWMPEDRRSYYYDEYIEYNYTASAIGKSDGNLTLAIAPTSTFESTQSSTRTRTSTYTGYTSTVTWAGQDRLNYKSIYAGYSSDITYAGDCTIETASSKAICVETSSAADDFSSVCEDYTSASTRTTTRRITYDTVTVTQVETTTPYRGRTPSFCLSGSTLPESYYVTTRTYRAHPYAVVVTAGEEKISATAGSAPTGSGSPTGSASGSQGSAGAPPTGSGNAAHPMITVAPALAGFGAAAAALFL